MRWVLGTSEMRIAAMTTPKATSSGRAARISGKVRSRGSKPVQNPSSSTLGKVTVVSPMLA